VDESEGKNFI